MGLQFWSTSKITWSFRKIKKKKQMRKDILSHCIQSHVTVEMPLRKHV